MPIAGAILIVSWFDDAVVRDRRCGTTAAPPPARTATATQRVRRDDDMIGFLSESGHLAI
jgi:hypothetical protein